MGYISDAMGWILAQISRLFGHNFAASVLVFTILVNVIMLPLTLKSQKATAKQARLKPKLDALKKKFGDDRQKYSAAMQELYNKEGVSMGGGCMPMIIRLVIMMGVYWAVASPFTYVVNVDKTAVTAAYSWTAYVKVVNTNAVTDAEWKELGLAERADDADIIATVQKYNDGHDATYYAKLSILDSVAKAKEIKDDSVQDKVLDKIKANVVQREVELANYVVPGKDNYSVIVNDVFVTNKGDINKLDMIDFDLFGIDLTVEPKFSWNFSNFNSTWIIPILSFVTAMASSIVTMKIQKKANPDAPNMGFMMLLMPLFSLYIGFKVPGAVGFYWACSNVVSGGLQVATQLLYGPNVVVAKNQAKAMVERGIKEKQRMDKIDAELNSGSDE